MERWIIEQRRKTCLACPLEKTCVAIRDVALWFSEAPTCPLNKLASRNEAIAARAWPAGVEPISGCCDPP
jgi:hypothetical protein